MTLPLVFVFVRFNITLHYGRVQNNYLLECLIFEFVTEQKEFIQSVPVVREKWLFYYERHHSGEREANTQKA